MSQQAQAFLTKEQRDMAIEKDKEFLVEELKYHVLMNLRTLAAKIGSDNAREWVKREWTDLLF